VKLAIYLHSQARLIINGDIPPYTQVSLHGLYVDSVAFAVIVEINFTRSSKFVAYSAINY
jgi:hypothetical protein